MIQNILENTGSGSGSSLSRRFSVTLTLVAISRQEIRQGLILTITGVIVLASLLFVAILCTTLSLTRKYVFKPLVKLEFSARRIAEGELDTTIDASGGDEIAQLAQAFDTMAHKLKISFATLEHKVNERTADLIDAKIEAEKINQDLRSAGARIIETAEGLEGVVWSVEDISHRLRLEEELLKVKKLESIAVLAGSNVKCEYDIPAVLWSFNMDRVMIMDDEEIVRRVVCDMLSYLGYEGIEAGEGHEALSLYERSLREGQRIDAVIMDLTIPGGMGGRETIQRLLHLDPQARAIVSSGYFDASGMHDFRAAGFADIVSKPYQMLDLSRVLCSVLAGRAPPDCVEKN